MLLVIVCVARLWYRTRDVVDSLPKVWIMNNFELYVALHVHPQTLGQWREPGAHSLYGNQNSFHFVQYLAFQEKAPLLSKAPKILQTPRGRVRDVAHALNLLRQVSVTGHATKLLPYHIPDIFWALDIESIH